MKFKKNIDSLCVDNLKINALAAITKAKSGHPGIAIDAATILHTLFCYHLKYDPKHPLWVNRDRFILSSGHGSALLYAMLRMLGLISRSDLEKFRSYKSNTPGHPEYGLTPGIEASTGPLGQGIAMAVGMALAESQVNKRFPEFSHYTYVLCGDGDLQEGVAQEALSFAGTNKLNKLIVLYDSNDVQLDSFVKSVNLESPKEKYKAMGFKYILVNENSVKKINKAINKAKYSNIPVFIEIKTIIGEGTKKENSNLIHGQPLTNEEISDLKDILTFKKSDNFEYLDDVKNYYIKNIYAKNGVAYNLWNPSKKLMNFLNNELKINLNDINLNKNDSTRNTTGFVLNNLGNQYENIIAGSADLSSSTKIKGVNGVYAPNNRLGRNILYGVREFAMGAIANGIALHSNFRPIVSTFLTFSNYLIPAIRLAAQMRLKTLFIFSHDSVYAGQDGPTHQPIEQLASLRAMPNLTVLRPADENEVKGAIEYYFNKATNPVVIATTRQNIVSTNVTNKLKFEDGAYYIYHGKNPWTLIATGSELNTFYNIGKKLNISVISASNTNNLESLNYNINKAISFEAASTFGWAKYAKYNIGIDEFGISATEKDIIKHFNLDEISLQKKVEEIIKRN
ncbi:transketolase-like TK C-terminal-containing protein [Metamycoplasma buccale]|uniref:transketolase-like TK C-terminal-containing protein n=1 Tax=Metamycoplasma buccale TaxID=55602 RepID=UPI00398E6A6D